MLPYPFLSQRIQLWFALYCEEGLVSRPVQLEFKKFDCLSTLNGTAYKQLNHVVLANRLVCDYKLPWATKPRNYSLEFQSFV